MNPRPVGFGLAGTGLDSEGNGDLGWGDEVTGVLDVEVGSGDRTSPASCIAASSSALVGSLIGDLVLVASGDEDADCLAQVAVAFFTDAKVDRSGDDCSRDGVTAAFGGGISFRAVVLGLSTSALVALGGVGKGREKRD